MRKNIATNKPSSDYPVAIPMVWMSAVFVVTLLSLVVTNFITRQLVGPEPTTAELFTTLLGIAIIGTGIAVVLLRNPPRRKQKAERRIQNGGNSPARGNLVVVKVLATLVATGVFLGSILYALVVGLFTVMSWSIPPADLLIRFWVACVVIGIVFVFIFFGKWLWEGQKQRSG